MSYNQMRGLDCYHYLAQIIICLSICVINFNGIQHCSAATKVPNPSIGYYHGRGNPPGEQFLANKLKTNATFDLLKSNDSWQSRFHLLQKLNHQLKVINKDDRNSFLAKRRSDQRSVVWKENILNLTSGHELANNTKNDQTTLRYFKQNNTVELVDKKRMKRCSTNTLSLKQKPLNLQKPLDSSEKRMACCEIINKLIAQAFKIQNNCKCASDDATGTSNRNDELVENPHKHITKESEDDRNRADSDKTYPIDDNYNSLVETELNAPQETKLQTKRNNYIEPTEDGLEVNDNDKYRVNGILNEQDRDSSLTDDANTIEAPETINDVLPRYPVKLKSKKLSEETTIKAIINDTVTFIYTESSKRTVFETETETNEFTSDIRKNLVPEASIKSEKEHEQLYEDTDNNEDLDEELYYDLENSEELIKKLQHNEDKTNQINSDGNDLNENQVKDYYEKTGENNSANLEYRGESNTNNKPHKENNLMENKNKLFNVTDEADLTGYDANNEIKDYIEINQMPDEMFFNETIVSDNNHNDDEPIEKIENDTILPLDISHYNIENTLTNDDRDKIVNTSQDSYDQTNDKNYNVALYQTNSTKSTSETRIVGDIQEACRNYYSRNEQSQTLSPFDILLCTSTDMFNYYIGNELVTVKPMELTTTRNDNIDYNALTNQDMDHIVNEDFYHNRDNFGYNSKNSSENVTVNNIEPKNNQLSQNMLEEQQTYNSIVTGDEVNKIRLTNKTVTLTDTTLDIQPTQDNHTILGMPVTEIIDISYNSAVPSHLESQNMFTETPNEFSRKQTNNKSDAKLKHIQSWYETTPIPLTHFEIIFNNSELINETDLNNKINDRPLSPFTNSRENGVNNNYDKDAMKVSNQDSNRDENNSENGIKLAYELDAMTHDTSTSLDKNATLSYNNMNNNIVTSAYDDTNTMIQELSNIQPNDNKLEIFEPSTEETNNNGYIDLYRNGHTIAETNDATIQPKEYAHYMNSIVPQSTGSNDINKDGKGNRQLVNESVIITPEPPQSNEHFEKASVSQQIVLHDPVVNLANGLETNELKQKEINVIQPVTEADFIPVMENDLTETQELDTNYTDNNVQQEIHVGDLKVEEETIIKGSRSKLNDKFEELESSQTDLTELQDYINGNKDDNIYAPQIAKNNNVTDILPQEFTTSKIDVNPLQEVLLRTTTKNDDYIGAFYNTQTDYITVAPLENDSLASGIKIPELDTNNIEENEINTVNHENFHKKNEIIFEPYEPVVNHKHNIAVQEVNLNTTSINDINNISESYATTDVIQLDMNYAQESGLETNILNNSTQSIHNNDVSKLPPEANNTELSPLNKQHENSDTLQPIVDNDTNKSSDIAQNIIGIDNIGEMSFNTQHNSESTPEPSINDNRVVVKQNHNTDLKYNKESNTAAINPDMITKQFNNVDAQYVTDSTDIIEQLQNEHLNELSDENSIEVDAYVNNNPDNKLIANDLQNKSEESSITTEKNGDRIDLLPSMVQAKYNNNIVKGFTDTNIQDTDKTNDLSPLQIQQNDEINIDQLDIPRLIPLGIVSDLTAIDEKENAIPAILHLPVLLTLTNLTLIDSPDSKFYIENNGSKLEFSLLKSETPKTSINPYYVLMDRIKHSSFHNDNSDNAVKNKLTSGIFKRMNSDITNQGCNKTIPPTKYGKYINESKFAVIDNLKKNYNNSNDLYTTSTVAVYERENLPPENQTFFRHSRYKEMPGVPKEISFNSSKDFSNNSYSDKYYNNNHSILTNLSFGDSHSDISNKLDEDSTKTNLESSSYHKNKNNHLTHVTHKANDHAKSTHQINRYGPYKQQINKDIYEKFLDVYNLKRYRNKNDGKGNLALLNDQKPSQQSKRSLGTDISDTINRIKNKDNNGGFTKDQSILDVLYTSIKRIKDIFTE